MRLETAPLLRWAASLWLTLALLAWVVGALALSRWTGTSGGAAVTVPFAVLFVNLLAAIAVHKQLRRKGGLLVFHLGLAMVALVAAGGSLFALKGHVEITQGFPFDPLSVDVDEAGSFHFWRSLDAIKLIQGSFSVKYAPQMNRRETRSTVLIANDAGVWREEVIGDDVPLKIEGYRFYTTSNKGFAPILTYTDGAGKVYTGSVHMPSYPINDFKLNNEWIPPGANKPVMLWLKLEKPLYDEKKSWTFRTPKNPTLIVIQGRKRREIKVGETLALGKGTLRFDEVRSWVGYTIFYDPTMAWMLAASVVSVLGLAWHVLTKFRAVPWDQDFSRKDMPYAR